MSVTARVKLWGRTIGAVLLEDGSNVAAFQYDPDFAGSGIQVSPMVMPLSHQIYSFPDISKPTFHGLPGLVADSLPDKFGNALIDAWLVRNGRNQGSFSSVERLCYTGKRGMGALEYEPAAGPKSTESERIEVAGMVELASKILTERTSIQQSIAPDVAEHSLRHILRVGTSAGGARAKAVIAWNRETEEVRSGQVKAPDGFEYWLIKFDGVSRNRDKELDDPEGMGRVEYAYHKMAADAGIAMSECRLLEENGRSHFMTKRFDRSDNGQKLHMQSLCALEHFDHGITGVYGYEQVFHTIRKLGLPMEAVEQQYRRMVFNILARNQDDHVKNIAFLMDKDGKWQLSPAFDMTYAFDPTGNWTSVHQMTMNGKRDQFTLDDFRQCAKSAMLKRGQGESIVKEIQGIVDKWMDYAEEDGVDPILRDAISTAQRDARIS